MIISGELVNMPLVQAFLILGTSIALCLAVLVGGVIGGVLDARAERVRYVPRRPQDTPCLDRADRRQRKMRSTFYRDKGYRIARAKRKLIRY